MGGAKAFLALVFCNLFHLMDDFPRILFRVERHECRPALDSAPRANVRVPLACRVDEAPDVELAHVVDALHDDFCLRVLS